MRFWKAIRRKRRHLVPQHIRHLAFDAIGLEQTVIEPFLQRRHTRRRTFRPHGPPQIICLRRAKPSSIFGNLHELFLKKRDAQCFFQRRFKTWMVKRHGINTIAALNIRMHTSTLDGAWTDQRNLHHQIKESPWF